MNYIDTHCHILFGIDDGAYSANEAYRMLIKAKEVGISRIICTPHVYSSEAAFDLIDEKFRIVNREAEKLNIKLIQGYELNYRVLLEEVPQDFSRYCFQGTKTVLLEPPSGYLPDSWEQKIYNIQYEGIDVILAHPERCRSFQDNIENAKRMVDIGCQLQISACDIFAGLFSDVRRTAIHLLKEGLVSYIASDAHCQDDYYYFKKAMEKYAKYINNKSLKQK